jgi:ribonuclease HI
MSILRYFPQIPESGVQDQPPGQEIIVFTDGSCFNNGSRNNQARAGYAAVFPDHAQHNCWGPLSSRSAQTNNRAELTACLRAFETADTIDPQGKRILIVYTDSQLMIDSLTKWLRGWKQRGWKKSDNNPVLNRDLLEKIDEMLKRRPHAFRYVAAHTQKSDWASIWNDKADQLARKAARSPSER